MAVQANGSLAFYLGPDLMPRRNEAKPKMHLGDCYRCQRKIGWMTFSGT